MKRFFLILAAIVFSLPLSGGFVRAAEPVTTPVDAAQANFETRRMALRTVFQLTQSEINDLLSRLAAVDRPTDPESLLVYNTLKENLGDYRDLIESRIEEVDSDYFTRSAILVTADNFKKWRETVYDPGTRELFDFLILYQGSLILPVVEARYEKVAADVESLKASVAPEKAEAFQLMLQDARTRVENAKLFRDRARVMFLEAFKVRHGEFTARLEKLEQKQTATIGDIDASPLTASVVDVIASTSPEKITMVLDTLDMTKETVQTLMKRAVDEIATIYKIFLQMRDLVHQR